MQIRLFAVGEGVRDRILAGNSISLNENLAKCREGVKAGRARKNRNRSSELNGKNRYRNPQKAGLPDGGFAMDKAKQSENASPTE